MEIQKGKIHFAELSLAFPELVNPMFASDSSGIFFTRHPGKPNKPLIVKLGIKYHNINLMPCVFVLSTLIPTLSIFENKEV